MAKVPGIAGYAKEAPMLFDQYEIYTFEKVHAPIWHLLPSQVSHVLEIGAGTGRDAAGFAALGHTVVAVEPVDILREGAQENHPHPNITWVDDGLPELESLAGYAGQFDLVMMTAVLMHLDEAARARALQVISGLLKPGGEVIMMLRHGPVPPGRTMFEVTGAEIRGLCAPLGFECTFEAEHASANPKKTDVTWTRIILRKINKG